MITSLFIILILVACLSLNIHTVSNLYFNTPLSRLSSIALIFYSFLIMNIFSYYLLNTELIITSFLNQFNLNIIYFENSFLILSLNNIILSNFNNKKEESIISSASSNNVFNTTDNKMNPWFITGLTDADGNFNISISKTNKRSIGWAVNIRYSIVAGCNPADLEMLKQINNYFNNLGLISKSGNVYRLTFNGVNNCLIIKKHFDIYTLMTYKLVYYKVWSQVLNILVSGDHLNLSGLLKIIGLKQLFKLGLSELLKSSFPNYTVATIPEYTPNLNLLSTFWISGFITGDGHFGPGVSNTNKWFNPIIKITQGEISLIVLKQIKEVLKMGNIYADSKDRGTNSYVITKLDSINKFIILFSNVKFYGAKALDFADFCKIIEIKNNKDHLTIKGLIKGRKIANQMNSKRTQF